MTEDQTSMVQCLVDEPDLFFLRLKQFDKLLYLKFLQQALDELQQELGKG